MINNNSKPDLSSAIELTLAKQSHPVVQSAGFVVKHASHVSIELEALNKLAAELGQSLANAASQYYDKYHWLESAPTLVKDYLAALSIENRILFLTVFHTIGFCYWGNNSDPSLSKSRWTVTLPQLDSSKTKYLSTQVFSKTDLPYTEMQNPESKSSYSSSVKYNGSMALLVSMASNPDFLNLDYLVSLNLEQFKSLLGGEYSEHIDCLALLEERHEFIVSLAQKLRNENYLQFLLPLLATTSAMELALKLASELPGFLDIAQYQGQEILFLKRAQLLVSDIHHTVKISKIEELSAFADYKLPQLLRHYQVIRYKADLAVRIDQQIELDAGSEEEVEIRAATIVAVELIRRQLEQKGLDCCAAAIDNRLWLMSQKLDKTEVKPYHRCRTVFY